MPNYGSSRCNGCSGEDCCCCEVYIEEQADARYHAAYGYEDQDEYRYYDDYTEDDHYEENEEYEDGFPEREDFGDWGIMGMCEEG